MEKLSAESSERDGGIETTCRLLKSCAFCSMLGNNHWYADAQPELLSHTPLTSRKSNGGELVCYEKFGRVLSIYPKQKGKEKLWSRREKLIKKVETVIGSFGSYVKSCIWIHWRRYSFGKETMQIVVCLLTGGKVGRMDTVSMKRADEGVLGLSLLFFSDSCLLRMMLAGMLLK